MRCLLLLVIGTVAVATVHLAPAQAGNSRRAMTINVTHVERNRQGFLITVDLVNESGRTLFLPEAPEWRADSPGSPRIQSLDVEQWSDGKTNLLAAGRSLSGSLPPRPGYFSVGPCRDLPFDGHWISLAPRQHITDHIQAFEPPSNDYIPSSCTWRHAHLSDQLRVSASAYSSKRIQMGRATNAVKDFPLRAH